jgi:hypothetical protein
MLKRSQIQRCAVRSLAAPSSIRRLALQHKPTQIRLPAGERQVGGCGVAQSHGCAFQASCAPSGEELRACAEASRQVGEIIKAVASNALSGQTGGPIDQGLEVVIHLKFLSALLREHGEKQGRSFNNLHGVKGTL